LAAIWIVRWFGTLKTGAENELLWNSARAAAAFVGFGLVLALLAAVDRFIFDADQAKA
jgi:hypothetical protein